MKFIRKLLKSEKFKEFLTFPVMSITLYLILAICALFLYGINDVLNMSSCSVLKESYLTDMKIAETILFIYLALYIVGSIVVFLVQNLKQYFPSMSNSTKNKINDIFYKYFIYPIGFSLDWIWNKLPNFPKVKQFFKSYGWILVGTLFLLLVGFLILNTILSDLCN